MADSLIKAARDLYQVSLGVIEPSLDPASRNFLVRCCAMWLSRMHQILEAMRTDVFKKDKAPFYSVTSAAITLVSQEWVTRDLFPTVFSVDFPSHLDDSVTDRSLSFSANWPAASQAFRRYFSRVDDKGIKDIFANAFSVFVYMRDVLVRTNPQRKILNRLQVQEMIQNDANLAEIFFPLLAMGVYKDHIDRVLVTRKKPEDHKFINNVFGFSNASSNDDYGRRP